MKIVIGTRRSDLARIQGELVGKVLKESYPELEIEYFQKAAEGDLDQTTPLWQLPDRGVFTQDLSNLLLKDKIDIAVHSWKDYPNQVNDSDESTKVDSEARQTEIVATIKRDDPRDMLLVRKDRWEKICHNKAISVLSSSPRREFNLSSLLKELLPTEISQVNFSAVRGNIRTRLIKLLVGKGDALVVAKAALTRMLLSNVDTYADSIASVQSALKECYWMILPLTENPTAAGQGALALEIKSSRHELREMLNNINHLSTWQAVNEERKILKSFGGGCHQKIGVTVLNSAISDNLHGEILFEAGQGKTGENFKTMEYRTNLVLPPCTQYEHIWPKDPSFTVFSSKYLDVIQPNDENCVYWISKSKALPENWHILPHQIVCCAGVETWKKLAKRGVWVNASSESLGEISIQDLIPLVPQNLKWYKLSHTRAKSFDNKELIKTYQLDIARNSPRFLSETHFYWRSASLFKAMLSNNPQLITEGWHACGFGNTYQEISQLITDKSRLSIWTSYEAWKEYVCNSGNE